MTIISTDPVAVSRTALSYGLLSRDGLHLALPLDVLREVVPRPPTLQALPHDIPGLVGAHVLRGRVIPVVDLTSVLNGNAARDGQEIVAVLRHGSSVLGVLADSAEGIVTVDPVAQTAMRGGRHSVSSVVFEMPGTGGGAEDDPAEIVNVLDVGALFERFAEVAITVSEGADMNAVHGSGVGQPGAGGWDSMELPLLMTRCEDLLLGLPIGAVDGMQTTSHVEPSPVETAACLGVIQYREKLVPLIDPLAHLGLGRMTVQTINECLVLALDGGYVALLISEVIQLAHVEEAAVQPLPTFGFTRPDYLRGVWDGGDMGRFLLVESDVLPEDEDLKTFARLNTDVVVSDRDLTGRSEDADHDDEDHDDEVITEARTYVTFDVGEELATILGEIDSIIDPPADVMRYDATARWIGGVFAYRGTTIPLLDLPELVGKHLSDDTSQHVILVVTSETGTVGFRVNRLLSIEHSSLLYPSGQTPSGLSSALVPLDELPYATLDEDERMVPVLDLKRVAMEITGRLVGA